MGSGLIIFFLGDKQLCEAKPGRGEIGCQFASSIVKGMSMLEFFANVIDTG